MFLISDQLSVFNWLGENGAFILYIFVSRGAAYSISKSSDEQKLGYPLSNRK